MQQNPANKGKTPVQGVQLVAGDFFLLRMPRLPIMAYSALLQKAHHATTGPSGCMLPDLDRLLPYRDPTTAILREAILVASQALHAAWERACSTHAHDPGEARTTLALFRYAARMSLRATPFGLFSSYSIGLRGTRTALAPTGPIQRFARIDSAALVRLWQTVRAQESATDDGSYSLNPTVLPIGGKLRFVRRTAAANTYTFEHASVAETETARTLLAAARRPTSKSSIIDKLVAGTSSRESVTLLIEQAVAVQLLLRREGSSLTTRRPLDDLLAVVGTDDAAIDIHEQLLRIMTALAEIDGSTEPAVPAAVYGTLHRLCAESDAVQKDIVQVDLKRVAAKGDVTLSAEILERVSSAAMLLHSISMPPRNLLADFMPRFTQRYEGAAVSLLEVLDPEFGIGYGTGRLAESGIVDGIAVETIDRHQSLRSADTVLSHMLEDAWSTGRDVIELSDAMLHALATHPAPLAASMFASVTLHGTAVDTTDDDLLIEMHHCGGPSAAAWMTRFATADPELRALVTAAAAREQAQAPEVLLVEVLHSATPRSGNIASRPELRAYTLRIFDDAPSTTDSIQLTLADIDVTVGGGCVRLWSRTLEREIRPCFTTAVAQNRNAYPLVNFLEAVEGQQRTCSLGWQWSLFESAAFLPRVTHRNVILRPALWNIRASDFSELTWDEDDEKSRAGALEIRARLRLPRYVGVIAADNVLPVDLESAISVRAAVAAVQGRSTVRVRELLSMTFLPHARTAEGEHAHELIIPLFANSPHSAETASGNTEAQTGAQPSLPRRRTPSLELRTPGSEWVFVKVYGGPSMLDALLRTEIPSLVAQLGKTIDCWFFIRYADPDFHLRLRFRATSAQVNSVHQCVAAYFAQFVLQQRIARFEFATYVREVDRYGGAAGIAIAEQLFRADSECAQSLMAASPVAGSDRRWLCALSSAAYLLKDFGFTAARTAAFAAHSRDAMGGQFGLTNIRGT